MPHRTWSMPSVPSHILLWTTALAQAVVLCNHNPQAEWLARLRASTCCTFFCTLDAPPHCACSTPATPSKFPLCSTALAHAVVSTTLKPIGWQLASCLRACTCCTYYCTLHQLPHHAWSMSLASLRSIALAQAVVFCNHKPQAEWLAARLTSEGFPAAYLSGDRPQEERMEAMTAVRGFKLRVRVGGGGKVMWDWEEEAGAECDGLQDGPLAPLLSFLSSLA